MIGILCPLCHKRVPELTDKCVCVKCKGMGGESRMHGQDGRPHERAIKHFEPRVQSGLRPDSQRPATGEPVKASPTGAIS
jgi:hypothetical protein